MNLSKGLFLNIETHRVNDFDSLSPQLQDSFITHYYNKDTYNTPEEQFIEEAALFAEFSKVVCVSFGFENLSGGFSTRSFCGNNEIEILSGCSNIMERTHKVGYYLIGHAISTFDIPFLIKRYIINGIKVPSILNEVNLKPWERRNVDTMSIWKFGSFRGTSLETVCASLGIKCKSTEITGDNLHLRKFEEIDLGELKRCCEEDVESNYIMTKKILEFIKI